jgi:transposase-like protein
MTKPKKTNFSPEFRLETAQLVVDNGYTHQVFYLRNLQGDPAP